MKFRGYKLKEATINGIQVWAIVKYSFWGLIESRTMWASAMLTVAQAEKMRMELELKQNKK